MCSQNVADFELADHLVGRQAMRMCLHHAPRTLRPSIGSLCVRGFGLDSPVEGFSVGTLPSLDAGFSRFRN